MNPSNFTSFPYGSVFRKSEHETVARNIMTILNRTGNIFRPLSWEEYKAERIKDDNFSASEKAYFEQVLPYCQNEKTAKSFSPVWENPELA